MTDSETVIDDHPARPSTLTLEKWKQMKDQMEYSNDRTRPYHGMSPYAMKVRASVLNKFWRDHISDKCGLGGHLLLCDGSNGQGRRMERRKLGGIVPRRVHRRTKGMTTLMKVGQGARGARVDPYTVQSLVPVLCEGTRTQHESS